MASTGSSAETDVDGEKVPNTSSEESVKSENGKGERSLSTIKDVDDKEYPPMRTVAVVMVALYIAMFLVALDRIIISTAVPKITDRFHSIDDIGWYGSAYVLTSCATQLLFGRLYLFYDNKIVFLVAAFLFEVGSALCGAAPSSKAFILGRAIAGSGSSGVFSGVIVIMIPMAPLHKRPMYQGLLGAIFGIASVVGPLVGGAFTKNPHLTWRWCFYINLPIGAISILIILFFLHLPPPEKAGMKTMEKLKRLDPLGNLFFAPSIISLLLALQWGGTTYSWHSARVVALLVLFVVLLCTWLTIQAWDQETATVPPRIFLQRSIMSGFFYSLCIGGVMLSMGYYLPIWFQAIKGVDALESGIRGLPFILALVFSSIIAGGGVSQTGYYTPFMIACSCLMSIGAGLLVTLRVNSGSGEWIGYQVLAGLGMGLGMQQSGMAAQVVLKDEDVPIGASLMFFAQSLGGAVFVCAAQNVFINQLLKDLVGVPGAGSASVLAGIGATDLRNIVPPQVLPFVLSAYNHAIDVTFYVGTALACFSIIPALTMEWKSVKTKKADQVEKAEGGEKASKDEAGTPDLTL